MRSLVVYESYFGCTREVAEAIGTGLAQVGSVRVVPVGDARGLSFTGIDLVVVGGPTHAHGLSKEHSREVAVERGARDSSTTTTGFGLREWFDELGPGAGSAAAFDTRIDGSPLMTGRASKGIATRLHRHGFQLVAEPESFLVSHDVLLPGEAQRARAWAEALGRSIAQQNSTLLD
jgi:hypothetical protein